MLLLLAGCSVSGSQAERAIDLCRAHGGVSVIDPVFLSYRWTAVTCKDGTDIEAYTKVAERVEP